MRALNVKAPKQLFNWIKTWWREPIDGLKWSPVKLTVNLLLLNIILSVIVIPIGYYGPYEEPARYFREGRIMTWLSFFQLIYAGFLSRQVFLIRYPEMPFTLSHSGALWRLGSWSFVYLALDEMCRLHENIDRYLFHKLWGMEETALTDRIDDVIMGVYGIICLYALYKYRQEILRFLSTISYLIAASVGFAAMVALDIITDGDEILALFISDPVQLTAAVRWLGALEDVFKVVSECFFIGFFAACYVKAVSLGRLKASE